MEDLKIVYSLSDNRNFRGQALNSLKSLSRFVDKENITVICNPPYKSKQFERLADYGTLYQGSEEYQKLDLPLFRYKIELCDIKCDNLIFLDCDTIIMKDITKLLDGDYDFYAKEEPCRSFAGELKGTWNDIYWKEILKYLSLPLDALPYNDGFCIFKNRLHTKIKDKWIEYYQNYHNKIWNSPNTVDDMHHNEFALSLAIAGYKCKVMGDTEHFFGWRAVPYTHSDETYVLHIGTNKAGISGYLYNLSRHYIPEGTL